MRDYLHRDLLRLPAHLVAAADGDSAAETRLLVHALVVLAGLQHLNALRLHWEVLALLRGPDMILLSTHDSPRGFAHALA